MDRGQSTPDVWSDVEALEQAVLERLDQGTLRVPPYPSIVLALRNLVSQENYGLDEVLRLVSNDPSLVADVLRCANSAFFGRGSIASLQQAVGRIGAQQVTRLALVSGLTGVVRAPGPLAALRRQAWEMSLASAAICQLLAQQRKLADESAFVAGLLHDFGWMMAIAAIEEMLSRDSTAPASSEGFWSAAIESCHTRLGLALAERWNLPELLRAAVGLHHHPDPTSPYAPFVELVAISDRVIELLYARPLVSVENLSTIPELKPAECEALARSLPSIPELISSFASEPAGALQNSLVISTQSALLDGFRPLGLSVMQLRPRKCGPFKMLGIAPHGFVMKGQEALPEKQLVELELSTKPQALRFWAKVDLCFKSTGESWELECKPFALTGPALAHWNELWRSVPEPGRH